MNLNPYKKKLTVGKLIEKLEKLPIKMIVWDCLQGSIFSSLRYIPQGKKTYYRW